jgi:acyl carrier protein
MSNKEQLLRIVNEIYKNTEGKSVNLFTRIDELDFDSMEMLELLMHIEQDMIVELKIDDLKSCQTLADILNLINKNG